MTHTGQPFEAVDDPSPLTIVVCPLHGSRWGWSRWHAGRATASDGHEFPVSLTDTLASSSPRSPWFPRPSI